MDVVQAVLLGAILATLIGAFALAFGWRGRRVGDHPFCRRCGFDLFGQPDNAKVCPECGADLSLMRATIVGTRVRRPVAIAIGAVLLLIGLTPLGIAGWGTYQKVDWNQYKPVAWLVRDAQSNDRRAQAAALKELVRRQTAKKLSKGDVVTIIDAGLKLQGDLSRPWDTAWGDLIEAAHAAGMTSEQQWKTYAAQAASIGWLSARLPSKIRADRMVMTYFVEANARVGSGKGFYAAIQPVKTVVDGKEFSQSWGGQIFTPLTATSSGAGGGGGSGGENDLASLPLGRHSGFITVKVRVTDSIAAPSPFRPTSPPTVAPPRTAEEARTYAQAQQKAMNKFHSDMQKQLQAQRDAMNAIANGSDGKPTYANVEVKLPIQFELVGPGQPVAKAVTDEKFRAGIEKSLSVEQVRIMDTHVDLTVKCNPPPPVPLCFKVVLRDGTKEWVAGHANFEDTRRGRDQEWVVGDLHGGGGGAPASDKLQVVLRPDVEPDEWGRAPEVESYWGREVVLKDVPAEYPLREQQREEAQALRRANFLTAPGDATADDGSSSSSSRTSSSTAVAADAPAALVASAAPAAPAATSAPAAPTTGPTDIAAEIEQLTKPQLGLRDKLLAVPAEDFARYQPLLKLPHTGLIKLLPREKYGEVVVGIRGGGAYFSFVRKTHEYGYGSDIELGGDGRMTVGFAGGDYGYFLPLGDVPIEDIATATATAPKWASPTAADGWGDLWGDTPLSHEDISRAQSAAFIRDARAGRPGAGGRGVPSTPHQSYLLRSISPDEYDILVGLRVIRKFDDGSVVIAYKLLKTFDIPRDPRDVRSGRPLRPPRKLPATQVP